MNRNYTYIIASTPMLRPDCRPEEGMCRKSLEWIASQLEGSDLLKMRAVTDGFVREKLTEGFYADALASRDSFIRKFFTADLHLRNAKVAYLNRELGRPAGKGLMVIEGAGENPDREKVESIFTAGKDLLERERAIDKYLWDKADEITLFDSFTLGKVLSIVVKLCIIDRWANIDPKTGQEMLQKFTDDMRGTYGTIEFDSE